MKLTLILLTVSAVSGCVKQGDFCDLYSPVLLDREAASLQVSIDRSPAELIALHNKTYEACN